MAKADVNVRSLARAHAETAIAVLREIMTSTKAPAAARIAAAQALLTRGWGNEWQYFYDPKPQTENPRIAEDGSSVPTVHKETI